jgi:hypothetical protein
MVEDCMTRMLSPSERAKVHLCSCTLLPEMTSKEAPPPASPHEEMKHRVRVAPNDFDLPALVMLLLPLPLPLPLLLPKRSPQPPSLPQLLNIQPTIATWVQS